MSSPVQDESSRSLAGVRVLELSQSAACSYAGRLLVSLGADVDTAGIALEVVASQAATPAVLDWFAEGKSNLGIDAIQDLIGTPGRYDAVLVDLDARDPSLVAVIRQAVQRWAGADQGPVVVKVASVIGAGEALPGTALTAGAWSGMSWSMGSPGEAPLSLPYELPSFQAGAHAAAAVLTLLAAAPDKGALREVEVATRDVMAYYTGMITANFIPYERPWCRDGARPPLSGGVYPASIFPCRDGFVTFMCRSQREWDSLLAGMGSPDWSKDPKFTDPRVVARLHADEADEHLIPWIAAQTRQELMDFGLRYGLPIAPVKTFQDVISEAHFAARGFFTRATSGAERLVAAGAPWRFHPSPQPVTSAPAWPVVPGTDPAELLQGLRVLDLSWVWSGPMVTSMLADLGADIVKVEHAGHMDAARLRGRARRNGEEVEGPEHEVTPYFNQMNHGKRSLTLDLKKDQARQLVLELVAQCDAVVENMRPGALERIGLGYEELSKANPSLVMLSMSMAGQTGPLRGMKGYAGIMAAMSGLDSVVGYDEERVIGSLTPALGDPNGASHALVSLLAALHCRRRTGQGCWIDLSQIEAMISITPAPVAESQLGGHVPIPANTHPTWAPHGHFPCEGDDRWIAVVVRDDGDWENFVRVARASGTDLDNPDWRTAEGRAKARDEVERAVGLWTSALVRDEVVSALLEAGVPAAPVADHDDLTSAQWVAERSLTVGVEHPYLGPIDVFVLPWKFGGRAAAVAEPAPMLGAHTDAILGELLGADEHRIEDLRSADVLT